MCQKKISIQSEDEAYANFIHLLALTGSDILNLENTTVKKILRENITSIIKNTESLQKAIQINTNKNSKVTAFTMQNKDCFAVYSNNSKFIPLYCLEIMEIDSQFIIVEQSKIQKENVLQISALSANLIALLFNDAVEIWNTSSTLKPVQRIPIALAKQMDVGIKNDTFYVAVISAAEEKSLHYGAVEIYRAMRHNLTFYHVQTIDCMNPMQLKFAFIQQSDDLILNILTSKYDQPLLVFQYKGIAGFEQIVAASTLPGASEMHFFQLRSTEQHLIALFGMGRITFVEVRLKKY